MIPCPMLRGYILGMMNAHLKTFNLLFDRLPLEIDKDLFFSLNAKECLEYLKQHEQCSVILLQDWSKSFAGVATSPDSVFVNAVGQIVNEPCDLLIKNQGTCIATYLLDNLEPDTKHSIKLVCNASVQIEKSWRNTPHIKEVALKNLLADKNLLTKKGHFNKTTTECLHRLLGISHDVVLNLALKNAALEQKTIYMY